MNKKYMAYQLKSLLTLFVLILATLLLVGLIEALVSRTYFSDGYFAQTENGLALIAFSIAALILVSGLPAYCLKYQYKRQINDTYLQFPFKPKFLRFQSLLMPFLVFLGVVTVSFWFTVFLYLLRVAGYPADETSRPVSPNGFGYLVTYLMLLVALTAQYLIASFWHAMSSSSKVGSLSTILFSTGAIFFMSALAGNLSSGSYFWNHTFLMSGPANPIILQLAFFGHITEKTDYTPLGQLEVIELIIGTAFYYLCAIGAALFLAFVPERKGELAGSKTPSTWYEKLPVIFGLTALVALSRVLSFTISIPLVLLDLTFAYFVYSIYDYHLKISKSSGIMLGIQGFIYLLIMVVGAVV